MSHIIHLLRIHSSTIDKQNVLSEYTTPIEERMFQWAYNPTKTYGLHYDTVNWGKLGSPNEDMFILLNKLASRELSGNNAREAVHQFAEANGDLIKLICNKDLDCGVSAITLNKVFGEGFIPSFNIQLAKEEDIDKLKFPLYAQLKYNGARVITLIENGVVTFKSRGGHEFSFPDLANELKCMPDCMLDGELTIGDSRNEDHTKVSGMVNSAIKGTPIKDDRLVYNIFDVMALHEFNSQKCNIPYNQRLKKVAELIMQLNGTLEPVNQTVVLAITTVVESKTYLSLIYEALLLKGYEGLILKGIDSLYTFKKNKTWIKMKAEETADLLCIDYVEGKNKYEGMIGSLTCRGTVEGKVVQVDVSGLTDLERSKSPNYYIGKIIEIKYNKVIANKNSSLHSLFLPRFVCVREDKSNG